MRCSEGRVPDGGERYNKLFHRRLLTQCFGVFRGFFCRRLANGDNGGKIPACSAFSSPPEPVLAGLLCGQALSRTRWSWVCLRRPLTRGIRGSSSKRGFSDLCFTSPSATCLSARVPPSLFPSPAPPLAGKTLSTGCQRPSRARPVRSRFTDETKVLVLSSLAAC